MVLLAIDTSAGTSVAVVDRDAGILSQHDEAGTRRHAEVIGLLIQAALADAGVAPGELSGVVAGMGPGPFTGLRVGFAAARAFAAGIGRPVVPLISHDAFALDLAAPLAVVTDARRREVAWSTFGASDELGLPVRIAGPELAVPASSTPSSTVISASMPARSPPARSACSPNGCSRRAARSVRPSRSTCDRPT